MSTFIADLHSGKLHREFHHGPDPTTTTTEEPGVSRHTTFILFLIFFFHFIFRNPGLLSQFIADLHSGKLHRDYHYGTDSPEPYPTPTIPAVVSSMFGGGFWFGEDGICMHFV